MARMARLKAADAIFHIMCKSISEVDLYRDSEDKEKYLSLVKKYKDLYKVKIYGYCLMDNHVHLLVDSNGSDISKVMHGINFSYATYFNKKYKRDGHLFKDRFKSKIVDNESYLRTVSLYIHNNPTDIGKFKDCPETYAFSSLGIYIGKRRDHFNIIDYGFVMGFFGNNLDTARKNYISLVLGNTDEQLKDELEFKGEKTEYRSGRIIIERNFTSEDVLKFIASKMNISELHFHRKYSRKLVGVKALTVVLLRGLCNFKFSDISSTLGNITQARISQLTSIGIEMIGTDKKYESIIEEFIESYA
ncbi:transposase [Clostridium bowmanii]|uniref:transposase n=1 Tax=Clostridium bowmanii TaxID=132925 RepID=UPI001C0E7741|nr:transposase [Clostridium bowmanii]MBU3188468.1 transposase [Clostridium bowmanii]MCA1072853.1 transposase [Clostridium bowmanii]